MRWLLWAVILSRLVGYTIQRSFKCDSLLFYVLCIYSLCDTKRPCPFTAAKRAKSGIQFRVFCERAAQPKAQRGRPSDFVCKKKIRKKWKRSEKNNMKEKKGLVVNFIYFRLRWRILPRYWSLNDRLLNEWSAQQHTYGRARGLGWSCCIGERIRSRGAEDKNEAGKSSPNNRNVSLN